MYEGRFDRVEESGVMWDKQLSAKIKGNVWKTSKSSHEVGLNILRKRQKAELKMLRFALGAMKMEKI